MSIMLISPFRESKQRNAVSLTVSWIAAPRRFLLREIRFQLSPSPLLRQTSFARQPGLMAMSYFQTAGMPLKQSHSNVMSAERAAPISQTKEKNIEELNS